VQEKQDPYRLTSDSNFYTADARTLKMEETETKTTKNAKVFQVAQPFSDEKDSVSMGGNLPRGLRGLKYFEEKSVLKEE
jgi:hypothetical protein